MNNKKTIKFLNFQMFFSAIVLIFIVCSFFIKAISGYREIALGLLLLVMAYGNKKIYQRKSMTILYLVFGLILIVTNVVKLIAS